MSKYLDEVKLFNSFNKYEDFEIHIKELKPSTNFTLQRDNQHYYKTTHY